MHEITYTLTEDDLLAFSEYHHSKSPTARGSIRKATLAGPVIFATGAAAIWFLSHEPALPMLFLAIAVLWVVWMPLRVRMERRAISKKFYREGKNLALFKPQTLRIEHDVLFHETIAGSSRTKWEYIERIETTDNHAFIYVSAVSAHIVPKHAVSRGDYDSFVDEARKHWRDATASQGDKRGDTR